MLKTLIDAIANTSANEPIEAQSLEQQLKSRNTGKIFLIIFSLIIISYKVYFPANDILFGLSILTSFLGISLYFVSTLNIYYIKKGLPISHGRRGLDSRAKLIHYLLSVSIAITSLFLPILIKVYL